MSKMRMPQLRMTSRLRAWLITLAVGLPLALAPPRGSAAQLPADAADSPTIPNLPDVSPEILRLAVEDQWDRGQDMFTGRQVKPPDSLDWAAVAKRDLARQAQVRLLLAKNEVRTGRDFHFAALVFQHSDDAQDVRLAHVLATTAVAIGYRPARWLSAATLDRYLLRSGQSQIFGTQFNRAAEAEFWTMDPYDREAIPDSVRNAWCVVPLEEQMRILRDLRAGKPRPPTTSVPDCP